MPSKSTTTFAFRLPEALQADITRLAAERGIPRGELLRLIIIDYFGDRHDGIHAMLRHVRRQSALLERLLHNDPDPDIIGKIDRQLAATPHASSRRSGSLRHGS